MNPTRFLPLVCKQIWRHRARTLLTAAGVAIAMFLFTAVQAMQRGVTLATQADAGDVSLVVYRKDRFCPATSLLPQDYERRIARLDGVASVMPIKVLVNNCRTSLDVVTFRGVPKDGFLESRTDEIELLDGSVAEWKRRTDAVLVGETLAQRRNLRPGMTFDAAGVTAYVAGVVRSDRHQDWNTAYAALSFVQLAGDSKDDARADGQLGIVTQFEVRVTDPALLEPVAARIDEEFDFAQDPTATFTEQAFVSRIADDVIELVGFARWLGLGALAAVLALVANAIVLGVQSRISEHAVLQTLGYSGRLVAALIIAEGVLIALVGGVIGAVAALIVTSVTSYSLSVEGLSIPIVASPTTSVIGWDTSAPTHRPPGATSRASRSVSHPVPDPTSSTRSDGWGRPAASRATPKGSSSRSKCSTWSTHA